eukprot:Pgem_evm2s3494
MANLNSNGSKIDNLYKGPYRILKRVGDKHYNLTDVERQLVIINAYPVPIEQLAGWQRLDLLHPISGVVNEINKIKNHSTVNGVLQYLVEWKDGTTSWENRT